MRYVSFVEQLVFIVANAQVHLPESLETHNFRVQALGFLVRSGKYFDRLLELAEEYDEHVPQRWNSNVFVPGSLGREAHQTVLFDVLEMIHGKRGKGPTDREPGFFANQKSRWAARWLKPQAFVNDAEIRRRSCMDVAMWGNAVRHVEALRLASAEGDLVQPLAEAFFTCFVSPEAQVSGSPLKPSILDTLKVWVDCVPRLRAQRTWTLTFASVIGWLAAGSGILSLLATACWGCAKADSPLIRTSSSPI
jgi:hypothetical protein